MTIVNIKWDHICVAHSPFYYISTTHICVCLCVLATTQCKDWQSSHSFTYIYIYALNNSMKHNTFLIWFEDS